MSKHSADDRWMETLPPMSFTLLEAGALDRNSAASKRMHKALVESFRDTAPQGNIWPAYQTPYWRRVWDALRGH